ncbi:MAG: PrsW family intramembrane metalloprotease [Oscillospiraceae bacterium]|nr:PrsW family intramembrane metalloprotease [Oscillospiraceae bacterium]
MEHMTTVLFICIALPMLPMILIFPDKRSRLFLGFMITGALICHIAGDVNTYLLGLFDGDMMYVTTTITPISEELLKTLPVLFYAAVCSDDRDILIPIAFAEGIGFAILENSVILIQNLNSVSLEWALARVIGAALMHGACTAAIGMGISFIRKRRKLFFCGTFSLLIAAFIFHASFNVLVQSEYSPAAFVMPAAVYVPLTVNAVRRWKGTSEKTD